MKKVLLSLLALAFAGQISAQSLQFDIIGHDGNVVEANAQPGRYEVIGEINEMMELTFDMNIMNLTDAPLTLTCERVVITENPTGMNYFCWGSCFSPDVSIADVEMEPGVPGVFNAHWMAVDENFAPAPGSELTVEYHFYERGGDPYIFEVYFKYDGEDVADYNNVEVFSNAYPNPATNIVSFNHNLPNNAQSAAIAIFNMMGQEVIRQNVNIGNSKTDINVSDLTNGVYFYSLIINDKSVKTNKLVISK